MKKISLLIVALLFGLGVYSQDIDTRLSGAYSEQELKELMKTDQEKYTLLVYALDHGTEVMALPEGKGAKLNGEINVPSGMYTFADLGLTISDSNQYYRIAGTNTMLVVKSFWVLKNEKNETTK